jgi:hypothetical protein
MMLSCVVTPCGLVGGYESFENILSPNSAPKIETVCSSAKCVPDCKAIRHYNPQHYHHAFKRAF